MKGKSKAGGANAKIDRGGVKDGPGEYEAQHGGAKRGATMKGVGERRRELREERG